MKSLIRAAAVGVAIVWGTGCAAAYWKVHDPTTGKVYYTEEVTGQAGATQFRDAKTGAFVTIQNSEVTSISKEEFETARAQP